MTMLDIATLAQEEGKAIYSFCYRLTGNREEADDLYQETFLQAVEMIDRLKKENNPKCFLIGIAIRLQKNQKQKTARRIRIAPMVEFSEETTQYLNASEGIPEEAFVRQEYLYAVRDIIQNLPEKARVVIYMYYTAELSINEIASTMRIPVGTVKSRLHKARQAVRTYWEESGYEK